MNLTKSRALFARAEKLLPGGVNSPVRAFRYVGGDPLFIERGEGAYLYDVDGNRFLDYLASWGPLILGHCHPEVVAAVEGAVRKGSSFGAPTAGEVEMAELLVAAVPSIDMVRMVSSGTEAVMSAIRVARGYTGREKILKFEGCYHGHSDALLVKAGSGALTMGVPDSAGVTKASAADTLTAQFNDTDGVRELLGQVGGELACVVLEPVGGNCGVIPPQPGFLEMLREETQQQGIVLLFDEVITGFRVAYGGAQSLYGITPDMTTLGKIIGGGFPVGAYGGKREIMEQVAPLGPVYQAGTLSGNPVAMAAGIATLRQLQKPGIYETLECLSAKLEAGLTEAAERHGVTATLNRVGSMLSPFFTDRAVRNFADAAGSDADVYAAYFRGVLERGFYFAPSKWESGFVSTAHAEDDIEATVAAAHEVMAQLAAT
jgi:glutamate-1-semialdehyde 2,1-aminomutase